MRTVLAGALVVVCALPCWGELVTRTVEYRHGDTELEGYLAYDDAGGDAKRPGVLVIHEWWGINDYIIGRTQQLAKMGYVAFAPDIYGKGKRTQDPKVAGQYAGELRGKPLLRERAKVGLEVLAGHERVDPKRIAAIGYCFGGTTALQLAYSGADLAGVVSFHGSLPPPRPEDREIKAAVLVCHGGDDSFVPPAELTTFWEAMKRLGVRYQINIYSGAKHSFTNPNADKIGMDGVGYNAHADRQSWTDMRLFFRTIFREEGRRGR